MAERIEFVVQGEPASKARARFTNYGSKVRSYTPARTKRAEELVAAAYLAVAQPARDVDVAFGVSVEFLHETGQRRDVDNMLKLVLDGLNKIAWPDDVQVTEIHATKRRVPKGQSLTRVVIVPLGRIQKPRGACIRCGTEFDLYASTSKRKFCSRACTYASRTDARQRTCDHCGKSYEAHGPAHETRFCSISCRSAASRVTLSCVECGLVFTKPWSLAKKGVPVCSETCRAAYHRARRAVAARGVCQDCGGPTSRKSALRCRACHLEGRPAA